MRPVFQGQWGADADHFDGGVGGRGEGDHRAGLDPGDEVDGEFGLEEHIVGPIAPGEAEDEVVRGVLVDGDALDGGGESAEVGWVIGIGAEGVFHDGGKPVEVAVGEFLAGGEVMGS